MTKVVCDICGKEMERAFLKSIADYNFSILRHGISMDVCNDCEKAFFAWMQERKKEDKE